MSIQELRSMNQICDTMQLSHFLNPLEEVVEDNDKDIFAYIVYNYSINKEIADEVDGEEIYE